MSLSHNLPVNYTYFRDQVTSTSDKSHGSFISTGVRVSRVVDTPVVIANIEPSLYHQYIDVYGYLHATSNHDSDSDRAPMPNPAVAVAVASTINFPRFLEGTSLENHDAFNPFQRDPLHSIIHSSFYNSEDKQLEPNTNIRGKLAGQNISKVSKVLLYDHVWFQKNMKVEYSSENCTSVTAHQAGVREQWSPMDVDMDMDMDVDMDCPQEESTIPLISDPTVPNLKLSQTFISFLIVHHLSGMGHILLSPIRTAFDL